MSHKEISIGIDLGGTNVVGAQVHRDGNILEKESVPCDSQKGADAVYSNICTVVEKLMCNGAVGIGVGTPGPVNSKDGFVMETVNIPGWKGTPVTEMLSERFGLPAYLGNDANVAALAEYWQGAAKWSKVAVMLTLGTGIGGGIVIGGKVFEGTTYCAGELGHMSIAHDGIQCVCGKTGCIETYASANGVIRNYLGKLSGEESTSVLDKAGGEREKIDARMICDAAREGEVLARDVLEETGRYLGVFCGNLINALNPDVIVIGGGLSGAGEILFEPIRRHASTECLPSPFKAVEIKQAELGNDAGVLGAAALVFLA